jgi:hypothetical protein
LQESDSAQTQTYPVVAAVAAVQTHAGGGEGCGGDSLGERQCEDPYLKEIIFYLETGELPTEER